MSELIQQPGANKSAEQTLAFVLNGDRVVIENPDPTVLLSDYLHEVGVTGTKVACGQGGCGACTVLVSHQADGKVLHRGVNACLKALCSLDGMTVTTTEGIGNVHHGLDRAQHCIPANNGSQCGFCTPGFVMNAHAVLRHKPNATEQDMEDSFGGNICRCTGYRPILHGVRTLASDYDASQDLTAACIIDPTFPIKTLAEQVEIVVTPAAGGSRHFHSPDRDREWFRPQTLLEARQLKARLVQEFGPQSVKLVVGNTAIGIFAEKARFHIDVSQLAELNALQECEDGLLVGASVVIQDLIDFAEGLIARRAPAQTIGLRELVRHGKLISVCVDQIGGGFGGKQHRSGMVGAAAAVAARKLGKPIRLLYDRATDMAMVGKRHPYLGNYAMAFTPQGKLEGYRLDVHSDAGDSYDCSFAVMDLGLMMADGCYNVPNFQSNGTVYRTNKTSNTAMRTFGSVQPYLLLEEAVEHAAHTLGIAAEDVRRQNFYQTGNLYEFDRAPYGQALQFCIISELWDDMMERAEFKARTAAIEKFNQQNRYRKRGIVMLPQKYGIGFTEPRGSLNSSSALVNINFTDGSVTVVHGAVEMGQGVHTKIAQVAAQTLGIPIELIRIGDNHTDTIVNAPATAASTGYDLNAGAVEKCCRVLYDRLRQFCRDLEQFNPHDCISEWRIDWADRWNEVVAKAWLNRVSLSAAELYKTPHYAGPSESHPQGHPFLYFVWGVACSEVEIDCLTGEFEVLRSDLLYDAHKSSNPAIDIGQIEGAFVQGMGYVTTEHILFNEKGGLITDNTWTYKPPCSKTIPIDFRVHLHVPDATLGKHAEAAENVAVKSSKTTGEPSMLMGISVWFAIRRAIMAARQDHLGDTGWVHMDCPATSERIQMLCGVSAQSLTR